MPKITIKQIFPINYSMFAVYAENQQSKGICRERIRYLALVYDKEQDWDYVVPYLGFLDGRDWNDELYECTGKNQNPFNLLGFEQEDYEDKDWTKELKEYWDKKEKKS